MQPSRWLVRVMAAGEASKRLADVVRTARRCREGQQACLDEEGSRGGAVKRGVVAAVWRRPKGAAAIGCWCGCVHNRSE